MGVGPELICGVPKTLLNLIVIGCHPLLPAGIDFAPPLLKRFCAKFSAEMILSRCDRLDARIACALLVGLGGDLNRLSSRGFEIYEAGLGMGVVLV